MSRRFRCKSILSTWIEESGTRRLDSRPYLSGAIEAKMLLVGLPTEPIRDLTSGGMNGIVISPYFKRVYVDGDEHSIPLLGNTDILMADHAQCADRLARKIYEAHGDGLKLVEGATLITCFGTVGRMSYCRSDMTQCAASTNFMRINPDLEKIEPGYLYCFLSGRFGIPLVTQNETGSVVPNLLPSHIADLPVPRLGDVEGRAHELVQRAADLRTEANELINRQVRTLEEEIAGGPVFWQHKKPQGFCVGVRTVRQSFDRLDAFHHIGYVGEALDKAKVPLMEISHYAEALYPPFMKRIRVQEGGVEFLGGIDALTLDQRSDSYIASSTKDLDSFIVRSGYVLFQCDGQRYGIFGRPILANRNLVGKAVTQHMMRIIPNDIRDAGYIFTFLATEFGRRLSMRYSAGTSIPSLNENGARKILIFWPDPAKRHEISAIAERAWENRARAVELDDEARALVELAIEQGGR